MDEKLRLTEDKGPEKSVVEPDQLNLCCEGPNRSEMSGTRQSGTQLNVK